MFRRNEQRTAKVGTAETNKTISYTVYLCIPTNIGRLADIVYAICPL